MIQFDDGREVFQCFDLRRRRHSFKVNNQNNVSICSLRSGEVVIGKASHDRVEIILIFIRVMVQKPTFDQIVKISFKIACIQILQLLSFS